MRCRVLAVLALSAVVVPAVAQGEPDCPTQAVISNGVCIGKNGSGCSKLQEQSRVCYEPDPQYTDEAAKAKIKGTVRLWATVRSDGCASDIKLVGSLGFGLDEAAISALQRFRFRKPPKPMLINVEFNFDPQFSSRDAVAGLTCEATAHPSAGRK